MDEFLLVEEKNVEGDLTYEDICKTMVPYIGSHGRNSEGGERKNECEVG